MDIYRYMSFFELYSLLNHNKLKFSKLSLMEDKNEGLAVVFQSMLPRGLFYSSSTHKELLDYHNDVKDTNYISCWSKEENSIAMWLLYSKNKDYIRVKTTYKKLKNASDDFCKKNYWTEHLHSPEGTMQTSHPFSTVSEVNYKNYIELLQKVKILVDSVNNEQKIFFDHKTKDFKELLNKDRNFKFSEMRNKFEDEAKNIIDNALLIKDDAYKHESEIRAIIEVNRRNEITYDKWLIADKNSIPYIFGLITYGEVPLNYLIKLLKFLLIMIL